MVVEGEMITQKKHEANMSFTCGDLEIRKKKHEAEDRMRLSSLLEPLHHVPSYSDHEKAQKGCLLLPR
jgi:hypothetical protein